MSGAGAARFDGRLVVLTGVARKGQVGEVVARTLAHRGATVALLDRNGPEVEARANELRAEGLPATAFPCDITDAHALGDVVMQLTARHPAGAAALVCLAGGFAPGGSVADGDPDVWAHLTTINVTTAYQTTRAFLPLVRAARGSIVYFASAATLPGAPVARLAAYAAAKSGVVTLMRAVSQEERKTGVRANALAPTSIRTGDNEQSMGDRVAYVERETVAEWVAFLCAPESGPVSGQVIQLG